MHLESDAIPRLFSFLAVLILMALWEIAAPRRPLITSKSKRWWTNLSLVVLNTVAVRVLVAGGAAGAAVFAAERGWGLFNHLGWTGAATFALGIVALDLVVYLQHVLFHAIPLLWRFHMMHHSDLDFDVTTGARFHPVEILLSMGIKIAAVLLIGPSATSVVMFEVLLNGTSMFNHGNIRIPEGLDRLLRWVIVTPDMHRIHHSVNREETNSNFGFNLPWWDRLLGTYRPDPAQGQQGMKIGLDQFRRPDRLTLLHLLALPFVETGGGYSFDREVR